MVTARARCSVGRCCFLTLDKLKVAIHLVPGKEGAACGAGINNPLRQAASKGTGRTGQDELSAALLGEEQETNGWMDGALCSKWPAIIWKKQIDLKPTKQHISAPLIIREAESLGPGLQF